MRIWIQRVNPRNCVIETDRAFIYADLERVHYTVEAKGAQTWHKRYDQRNYRDVTHVETYRRQVSERYRQLLELVEVDF